MPFCETYESIGVLRAPVGEDQTRIFNKMRFFQKLYFVLILLLKVNFKRSFKTKNADTCVSAFN